MTPTKQTVYLPVKVEEDKTSILSSLPKEEWGVHRTHCCKKHGCKYSDEDCPVVLGHVEQDYRCEENNFDDCFEPNFNLDKQEGYFFTPEQLNEYTQSVIKQALETAAEKANSFIDGDESVYIQGNVWSEVDKQSITNTFEETYKKFEV
jgi:hypothetical protein